MSAITEMGRCHSVCPIMPTTDIRRTVQFYESLGYTVVVHDDVVMTNATTSSCSYR